MVFVFFEGLICGLILGFIFDGFYFVVFMGVVFLGFVWFWILSWGF